MSFSPWILITFGMALIAILSWAWYLREPDIEPEKTDRTHYLILAIVASLCTMLGAVALVSSKRSSSVSRRMSSSTSTSPLVFPNTLKTSPSYHQLVQGMLASRQVPDSLKQYLMDLPPPHDLSDLSHRVPVFSVVKKTSLPASYYYETDSDVEDEDARVQLAKQYRRQGRK